MITHLEETVSSWKATHTAFQQKHADRLVLYAQREAAFKERESADKREWEEKEEQYKREIAALDDRVGSILKYVFSPISISQLLPQTCLC